MTRKCDAVFEGGGVKGIGLVGAASAVMEAGYEFEFVAGTSAGAIVAALLAAGYTGAEITEEFEKVDFSMFQTGNMLSRLGFPGKMIRVFIKGGIYTTNYFESWMSALLRRKNKVYFGDIKNDGESDEKYAYKFQAIASDLSEGRMLVLPRDLKNFGFDPDKFPIARAVTMSMSIPLFYEPIILTDSDGKPHVIVDGGLLSNYPVWLLDENLQWPTFGFRFKSLADSEAANPDYRRVSNLLELMRALITTSLDAHDKHYLSDKEEDSQRTIAISTKVRVQEKDKSISSIYFDIGREEKEALYENGVRAAKEFLADWDFDEWNRKHRSRLCNFA